MPDGAQDSGDEPADTRDQDDPHRALDINLDEPLRDEERLPVLEHRSSIKSSTKSKTSKKEKVDKNEKIIIVTTDFWQGDYQEMPTTAPTGLTQEAEIVKKKKKKASKHSSKTEDKVKSSKGSSKKSKKGKHKSNETTETVRDLLPIKDDYEEALGISTPSKESQVSSQSTQNSTPQNANIPNLIRLANNNVISIDYSIQAVGSQMDEAVASLVITNTSKDILKNLEINVSDSKDVQLINELGVAEQSRRLDLTLNPGNSGEVNVIVRVKENNSNNRLRATVTYMQQSVEEGDRSTQEKLDLWLNVPVTVFITPAPTTPEALTQILSSGQLLHHSSLSLPPEQHPFPKVLSVLTTGCRLGVVERIDNTVSMYGRSMTGEHVCLLAKCDPKRLSIEIKSSDSQLLASLQALLQSTLLAST